MMPQVENALVKPRADALYLSLTGGTITGNLAITGTVDGVDVGAIPTTYLALAGGTMAGAVAMGGNSITGLSTTGQVQFTTTEYISQGAAGFVDVHWADDDRGARFYSGANLLLSIYRYGAGFPTLTRFDAPGSMHWYIGGVENFRVQSTFTTFYQNVRIPYDNKYFAFGTSADTKLSYNGNFIIDPDTAGTGKVYIGATADDDIAAANYFFGTSTTEYINSPAAGIGQLRGASYWRVGAGATNHSLAADGDFLVSGHLEVNGTLYADSTSFFAGNITASAQQMYFNRSSGADARFGFLQSGGISAIFIADHAMDQFSLYLGPNVGRQLVLTGQWLKDHDHAVQTNPTLYIHSVTNPDVANTQWLSLTHDQTDAVIATGLGDVKFTSNINLASSVLEVDGTQVVGTQGAAVADAGDEAEAVTQLNALLARCRAHGLIAA